MDLEKLKELIQILEASQLSEIEIEEDGRRVRLAKSLSRSEMGMYGPLAGEQSEEGLASFSLPARRAGGEVSPARKDGEPGAMTIDSPMVGVFYSAPGPGKPPFVNPGDVVEENHTVCIVEAMKLMNEITAKLRVQVLRVLVENGEPVEFGQPLFAVRPLA